MNNLQLWQKILLLLAGLAIGSGVGFFVYRYYTKPVELTVATGSLDGQATEIMSAIAARLNRNGSPVRLKVTPVNTMQDAAGAFASNKVDLAVIRADIGNLAEVRTLITMAHGTVMIIAPPGSKIDSIEALQGKTVGVVGGEMNKGVVAALNQEYFGTKKVTFKDLPVADARKALQGKQVDALLFVTPLTEKYLAMVRDIFQIGPKSKPTLIAIDAAGAISNVAKAYESFDIPKGTLRGSPPIPDDDLTTLRVPIYLVGHKKLDNDTIADLTRAIMNARRELIGDYPLLTQIAAPSTDKDAFIPIHPGAAEYYGDTQQGFFDKYSNLLYYGPVAAGALLSALLAIWKFLGIGDGKNESPLDPLLEMARRIRNAKSEEELAGIEDEIDAILKSGMKRAETSDDAAADRNILILATNRLESAVHNRRMLLATARSDLTKPVTT